MSATGIKVMVLAINSGGAPEFHPCALTVTDEQIANGEHYDLAIADARRHGYDDRV